MQSKKLTKLIAINFILLFAFLFAPPTLLLLWKRIYNFSRSLAMGNLVINRNDFLEKSKYPAYKNQLESRQIYSDLDKAHSTSFILILAGGGIL